VLPETVNPVPETTIPRAAPPITVFPTTEPVWQLLRTSIP
jgi:hypothetical protein